jgi:hypothetical protein
MQQTLRRCVRADASTRRQLCGRARRLGVYCRATNSAASNSNANQRSGYSSSSTNARSTYATDQSVPSSPSSSEQAQRVEQLRELVQETVRISVSTGPRGFFRAVQAAQSIATLAAEYLTRGSIDPLPVFLRKLFEKLGERQRVVALRLSHRRRPYRGARSTEMALKAPTGRSNLRWSAGWDCAFCVDVKHASPLLRRAVRPWSRQGGVRGW